MVIPESGENNYLLHDRTRPNDFGSMTARKDDILPLKTMKCNRKPYEGHKRPYKNTIGHTKAIKPYGAT